MAQVYLLVVKLWVRLVYKDRKLPMDRPQRAQTVACHHRYDLTSHPLATELGTVIRRLHLHLTTSSEYRAAQPKASTCHNHSRTAAHLGAQIRSIPTPLDHHSRQHHRTREASVAQHQQQACGPEHAEHERIYRLVREAADSEGRAVGILADIFMRFAFFGGRRGSGGS